MADDHQVNRTGLFITIFVTLVALTGISFWVANSSLMDQPLRGWLAMMAISVAKALLVILFFMHLVWETTWKFVLTIPSAVMSTLLVLILIPDIGNRTDSYSNDRQKFAAFELPKPEKDEEPGGNKNQKNNGEKTSAPTPKTGQAGEKQPVDGPSDKEKYADTPGDWGEFRGTFVVKGEVPAPEEIIPDKDKDACEQPMHSRSLLVDSSGGLKNVVVFLTASGDDLAIHPFYKNRIKQTLVLDNAKCRFEPHIALLNTAQTLRVTNSDRVGHNADVSSFHDENSFNKSIPSGGAIDVKLPVPEGRPIEVKCSSHRWMKSYLLVRDNPYMSVSASNGLFSIPYFPAGKWTIQFWHEKVGYLPAKINGQEITQGRKKLVDVEIKKNEVLDLGQIEIDASVFTR